MSLSVAKASNSLLLDVTQAQSCGVYNGSNELNALGVGTRFTKLSLLNRPGLPTFDPVSFVPARFDLY